MYDFHYSHAKKWWPGGALSLMYMDTDSFVYLIRSRDVYEDIRRHKDAFDTSAYPVGHKCRFPDNNKVLGKFKDECNSVPVTHFVGLRPKMYSMKYGGKIIKKIKGIKKYAVRNMITFEHFLACLNENTKVFASFNMIRSYNHKIYSVRQNKLALSNMDDKRFILPDGINTLPHGHKAITVE